jgi:flagellar biosynthesis/type III secretory pathway chaperone
MKKFLFTLLILIILGGVAFFMGWVQFSVPPGQFGVISSKTHGIDPQIVRSGEFRWIWYKLIPTNVHIAKFDLEYSQFPINYNSYLPSGDTYASFIGLTNADFSWNLQGEIIFRIDPQMLVVLSERQNLKGQEDLNNYLQSIAKDMEIIVLRTLSSAETDILRLERILSGNPDTEMETEIRNRFPEIRDFTLIIQTAKFPNFILYRQIRLLYEEFLANQREAISSSFARRAENHIETQIRFEELERYGDLLTRFPVLLEFMAMEGNINRNQ